jgi:hypothetical protein
MDNETLHSLIPLADFKAVLGIDDREDAMSRYCLITATYTIEQYCLRRLHPLPCDQRPLWVYGRVAEDNGAVSVEVHKIEIM